MATSVLLGLFVKQKTTEIIITAALTSSIPVLLVILYRIFNKRYRKEQADQYYTRTVIWFVVGISIPCAAILLMMIQSC